MRRMWRTTCPNLRVILALVSAAGIQDENLSKTGAAKDARPPAVPQTIRLDAENGNDLVISFGALVGKILGLKSTTDEASNEDGTLEREEQPDDELARASRLMSSAPIGCVPQSVVEHRTPSTDNDKSSIAVANANAPAQTAGTWNNSSQRFRQIVREIQVGIATPPISPPVHQLDSQPVAPPAHQHDSDLSDEEAQNGTVSEEPLQRPMHQARVGISTASIETAAVRIQTKPAKTTGSGMSPKREVHNLRSLSEVSPIQAPDGSEGPTPSLTNAFSVEQNDPSPLMSTNNNEKTDFLVSRTASKQVSQPAGVPHFPTQAGGGRDEVPEPIRNISHKADASSTEKSQGDQGGDDLPSTPAGVVREFFSPPPFILTTNTHVNSERGDRTTQLRSEGQSAPTDLTLAPAESDTFEWGGGRQHAELAFYATMSTKAHLASRGVQRAETRLISSDRVDLRFGKYSGTVTDVRPDTAQPRVPAQVARAQVANETTEDLTTISVPQARRSANFEVRRSSEVFPVPQHSLTPGTQAAIRTTVAEKQRGALPNELGGPSQARELPKSAATPSVPMREITVQVRGRGEARVEVTLHEEGGTVHVVVRAPDKETAASLRGELNELARVVEEHGYHIDTWTPSDTAPAQMQSSSQHDRADSQPWNDAEGRGQQGSSHEQGDQKKRQTEHPEWLLELQRRLSGEEG